MQNSTSNPAEDIFTFEIAKTTGIIIEDHEKKNKSIFKNIYDGIFRTIEDTFNTNAYSDKNEYPNNIFAIMGDRGTGKSSCMHSVAKMLSENADYPVFEKKDKGLFYNKSFEVIESTDPSFFDNRKNILEIFLGRLFSKFTQQIEKNATKKTCEKNKVLQKFEDAKNTLACMSKEGVCEDSSVDQLIDLSASVELRDSIGELINCFLDYVGKDYLVIPVDDIDLHTIYAYDMAEQIRKYLVQPRTIVLMALKIEQLEYAIERHYLQHYEKMLNQNFLQTASISDMAIKYLIKLIPQSHRFQLTPIENILSKDIQITNNGVIIPFKETSLKDIITGRIFQKTRFLFYNHPKEINPIVPRNLRECRYLLEFLIRMDNYSDDNYGKYNQQRFVDYFTNQSEKSLDTKELSFLKSLISHHSADRLNLFIINYLKERFEEPIDEDYPRRRRIIPELIRNIIRPRNTPCNVSTGDVMSAIRYYESKLVQESGAFFIFALKTLYSIKLYNFYNEKTDENQTISELTPIRDVLDKTHNYDILVGGAFFSEDDKQLENHYIKVDSPQYNQEVRKVISIKSIKEKLDEAIDGNNITNIEVFRTIEFFALTISRPYFFASDDNFRANDEPVYNIVTTIGTHPYVWFDIFSLFFNTTRIEQCYNRIDERLYKIATEKEGSLLRQIKAKCYAEKKYCKNEDHACLSCCCIRNIDVLENIRFTLINNVPIGENGFNTIKNILETCKKFNIKTYDPKYGNNNERYEINFKFADVLFEYMSNVKKETFEGIYYKASDDTQRFINSLMMLAYVSTSSQDPQKSSLKTISKQKKKDILAGVKLSISNIGPSKEQVLNIFEDYFEDIDDITDDDNSLEFVEKFNDFIKNLKKLPVIA